MKSFNIFSNIALAVLILGIIFFAFVEKTKANEISINCQYNTDKSFSFDYTCTGTPPQACSPNPISKQGYQGKGSCIVTCQNLGGKVVKFNTTAQGQGDWYCCNANNSGRCTIETTNDTSITKVPNPINDLLNPPPCEADQKKPHIGCKGVTYQSVESCGINSGELGAPCQEINPSTPPSGSSPTGKLEVDWLPSPRGTELTGESLTNLIQYLYEWGIGIGGFLAFIALIIAGFQYLTSSGNAGRMKDAMDRIKSAGMGLVLLFGSFIILNTINPQLTDLTMPTPEKLINSGWNFGVEDQRLSNPKNKPKVCERVLLYPKENFGGTPPGGAKGVAIGQYKNLEVKSIEIYGGCSVTLYDYPNCEQNAFGPYFSSGASTSTPTEYGNIEAGGVSSFGCVKVAQM
ncbi:MAG: pilin [Candidatus Nealsonbacteria bacterium]